MIASFFCIHINGRFDYVIRLLFVGLASMLLANACAAVWLWRKSRVNGPGLWALGAALICVGLVMIFTRGFMGDFLSIVVSNTLVLIGYAVTWFGMRRFMGRPLSPFVLFSSCSLIILGFIGFYYFTLVEHMADYRVIIVSSGIFVLSLCISNTLLSGIRAERAVLFTGAAYSVNTLVNSLRFMGPLVSPVVGDFMKSGTFTMLFLALSIAFNASVIFGQIWMVLEQDTHSDVDSSCVEITA